MSFTRTYIAPLALAAGLAATLGGCMGSSGAYEPGYVQTSAAQGNYRGEAGRVVGIRDIDMRNRKSGFSDGTLIGGGVGMAGGAAIGAATTNSVGGALVGGLLGAVAGGIAGTAIDQNRTRRGIEVTIQKDDGQVVAIAQPDDGDVQMGDRIQIVYDRNGIPRAVRDTGYQRDYAPANSYPQTNYYPQQDYPQQDYPRQSTYPQDWRRG
ncbi:MAG TPA: glycine zipper domain-containing protein [Reyranellaceae bacterium]|nr:glycine zipper domain-containing protein [Reyranellaceae bacterium]